MLRCVSKWNSSPASAACSAAGFSRAGLVGDAHISLEGDLRGLGVMDIPGASDLETATLKRNTVRPKQDFVVVPLEATTPRPSCLQSVGMCREVSTSRSSGAALSNSPHMISFILAVFSSALPSAATSSMPLCRRAH